MGLEDKALEEFFVHEAKLGLNTGVSFGEGGSGFMRLNIGTTHEILEIAMVRLRNSYFLRKKAHGA
jgi:cysteine-S-conjugate beta-lyase